MDNWSVYVVDGFDFAQPSGDRNKSSSLSKPSSLSVVEGTVNEADKVPAAWIIGLSTLLMASTPLSHRAIAINLAP
ncbi:hypothetical protein VB774_18745 [Pseudanabaena galeata UHCC 0370]|uniref:Uncharacterized protein n=1 Tax=Pseudanabaena galeata UHCC 0370 TaxID=3110310 RepID=A0ABU5TMX9_9CYAN|nr:hypothetical protein [Pseudanabaena galeata]MEA5479666.1 hypothetical protein [Pseudanabaena galeata UHCC 0370]